MLTSRPHDLHSFSEPDNSLRDPDTPGEVTVCARCAQADSSADAVPDVKAAGMPLGKGWPSVPRQHRRLVAVLGGPGQSAGDHPTPHLMGSRCLRGYWQDPELRSPAHMCAEPPSPVRL